MLEWLANLLTYLPSVDSTVGAVLSGIIAIGLFLVGRWALHMDRMTQSEQDRWKSIQAHLRTHDARHVQSEIRLSQTMNRVEVMEAIEEYSRRNMQQIADAVTSIGGRLDRMDARSDRMEERRKTRDQELLGTMEILLAKSDRRREDFGQSPRPKIHPHLVEPETDRDKDCNDSVGT